MPNWCNNVVEISHEDSSMMERVKTSFVKGEFLNEFIPVPADLKIVAGSLGDSVEQAELERKTAENVEKYGYGNWYDFCVNEWGTKWDVGGGDGYIDQKDNGTTILTFDSAWSPPVRAYEKLVDMGFTVRAYYFESGMGFAGVWEDGFDEEFNLEGTADELEEILPTDLNEVFDITENIRMWEEENQE